MLTLTPTTLGSRSEKVEMYPVVRVPPCAQAPGTSATAAPAIAATVRPRRRPGISARLPIAECQPRRMPTRAMSAAQARRRRSRVDTPVQARDGMTDGFEHPLHLVLAPLVNGQLDA